DLVFPCFSTAAVTMHKHNRSLDRLRPEVNHAQRRAGHTANRPIHTVQAEIQLQHLASYTARAFLHHRHLPSPISFNSIISVPFGNDNFPPHSPALITHI